MKHNMTDPCPHCPFRKDIEGYLTRERVTEIAEAVVRGQQSFPCHKTTKPFDNDEGESDMEADENSSECAGAAIFAARHGGSSQLSRIAERLGMKVASINMEAPICDSVREMIEVHCGKEEGEPCEIVNENCLAPAGYGGFGGGVIDGTEYVTTTCFVCGRYVCTKCSRVRRAGKSKGKRFCDDCMEESK